MIEYLDRIQKTAQHYVEQDLKPVKTQLQKIIEQQNVSVFHQSYHVYVYLCLRDNAVFTIDTF